MRFYKPIIATTGTLLLTSLAAAPGALAANHEWQFFTYFVTNSTPAAINRAFAQEVNENSGGRLEITVFTAGELPFKPTDVIKAVATDKIQMGDTAVGFVAGDVPELNVFSIPFACTSYDGFYDAVEAAAPIIEKTMLDRFDSYTLMNWTMPPQNIWTVDVTETVEGLEGRKIRAWNPLQVDMLDRFGASAISIAGSEVPTALQRKVIDGAITSALSVADWKIFESLKGGLMTNFMMGHQFMIVNKEAFDALPDDLKTLVRDTAKKYQDRFATEMEEADMKARQLLADNGMTVVEISGEATTSAAELMAPMAEQWVSENGDTAAELLKITREKCAP